MEQGYQHEGTFKSVINPITMTKIKVEIPEGFEVESFDESSAEVKLRPKPKDISHIQTVSAVLADHDISQEQFDKQCEGLEEDEKAYRILKLLAKSLNGGWLPDWSNSDEYKYVPWFWMDNRGSSGFRFIDDAYWNSNSNVGSRLCFKSKELAVHAGTHFLGVYQAFMIIQ
jgi:hypothetical protein